jgi:molybdopterin-binding protein
MEKLLIPREAATVLGITYRALKAWIHLGRVRSIKTFGGHHRVPESEIERLIPQKPLRRSIGPLRGYVRKISGRNQLIGRVLEVQYDGLVAQLTLIVGTQRVSADAAMEMRLKPGVSAAALFKSTEVMILGV